MRSPAAPPHPHGEAAARQVAEAMQTPPRDGRIELALEPAELGRVRLTLTAAEQAMTVVLSADRPETLELMRRHGEMLAGALRAAGYEGVSLDFAGGGTGRQAADPAPALPENAPCPHAPDGDCTAPPAAPSRPGQSLDLRV
ncbi:flagellar hook-length control protein FliK [Rhodovulum adriaticum]|uniref:Flagellar hook-length control protein FliK n=2 Tax=Rhodovulum adriaticum TaxID=35804 RepID=A0A4R2NZF2_RHOAD|nr:flagellar hook-length control protein FliK [Rhodovulum adriaticum]TCP27670.1 flagellar hook-length control protein FliK [Rhodovulum adriaticum]